MRYLVFLSLLLGSCYIGDEVPPDQELWEYDLPENNSLNQPYLLGINESVEAENYQIIEGIIIIKNDKLVFENYYFNDAGRYKTKNIGSAGLSFALAAIGVAEDQGLLAVDDNIAMYLPEYETQFNEDPQKAQITIYNLLTNSSGIAWNESISPYSPDNDLNLMKSSNDWIGFILDQPSEAPPGFRYSFNTANGVILAKIIENTSGQDYLQFLKENILDPLTITTLSIERGPNGEYNGGDGYSITLLDWVKLGYLFLNEGIWEGRRIIDPNFIGEATSVQDNIQSSRSFGMNYENIGYLFGLFGEPSINRFGVDHTDIFYSYGRLGQSLYMVPSENMVVGILADNYFSFNILSLNLLAEITFTTQ